MDQDISIFKRTMDINYIGTVTVIQAVLPGMRARHHGRIVITSSAAIYCCAYTLHTRIACLERLLQRCCIWVDGWGPCGFQSTTGFPVLVNAQTNAYQRIHIYIHVHAYRRTYIHMQSCMHVIPHVSDTSLHSVCRVRLLCTNQVGTSWPL